MKFSSPVRCTCRDFPGADEFCMAHTAKPGAPALRRLGETLTDDQLATLIDAGGEGAHPGVVASIAAELLARRSGVGRRWPR